jgi:hypothetical protein
MSEVWKRYSKTDPKVSAVGRFWVIRLWFYGYCPKGIDSQQSRDPKVKKEKATA